MRESRLFIFFFIFASCLSMDSCAQQTQDAKVISKVYVGSTPCDHFIRQQMDIPSNELCDFIRWELILDLGSPGLFQLNADYGESKPNTLEFKKGKHWFIKGTYSYTTGIVENPKARILNLHAPELKSPILFLEVDSSILHFADSGKRLLVGNGGWGYVLNRIQKP